MMITEDVNSNFDTDWILSFNHIRSHIRNPYMPLYESFLNALYGSKEYSSKEYSSKEYSSKSTDLKF
jgi:hypothetical protein